MISKRAARYTDLAHYLAASLLMVIALEDSHGWIWPAVIIAAYFAVCITQGIVYGNLWAAIFVAEDES